MSSTVISRAPPPISYLLHLMIYIRETGRPLRTRFGEHRRAVIGNDANKPVARHFNILAITVFQIWKFEPSVPFLEVPHNIIRIFIFIDMAPILLNSIIAKFDRIKVFKLSVVYCRMCCTLVGIPTESLRKA